MSRHEATISWVRNGAVFTDRRYSRAHTWHFGEDVIVPASASPHVVPRPYCVENAVDPEEAFVASLSSCHMLWFLDLAARQGFVVESYRDRAWGHMGKNKSGKLAMLEVVLRPEIAFEGRAPLPEELEALHHAAHESCFIAESVKTNVRMESE